MDEFGKMDPAYAWLLEWKEIDEKEGPLWFNVYRDLVSQANSSNATSAVGGGGGGEGGGGGGGEGGAEVSRGADGGDAT